MESRLFYPPGSFLKHLSEHELPSHRRMHQSGQFEVHTLDLTGLKLNASALTPFFISSRLSGLTVISQDELRRLVGELRSIQRDAEFSVVVVGGRISALSPSLRMRFKELRVAFFDRLLIEEVYVAQTVGRKHQLLGRRLVEYLGYELLSPYQPGHAVHGGRFFGRSAQLQYVLGRRDTSFTVIGNRRIGKTSFLREVRHRVQISDPKSLVADFYGGSFRSTDEAMCAILDRFSVDANRVSTDVTPLRFIKEMHSLAQRSRLMVIIDEADKLIELDSRDGWRFFYALRDVVDHHSGCRMFIAGFRRTRAAIQDLDSPLFNCGGIVELKRLSRATAVDMIMQPLRVMGIEISAADLPMAIYRETGGQPELIQIFGREIVAHFGRMGAMPVGTELLARVLESDEFQQRIVNSFFGNTTPYEELACYLLIGLASSDTKPVEDFEFTTADVRSVLLAYDINLDMSKLTNLLRNLELSGMIIAAPGAKFLRYQFSVPQLARYCLQLDLELCIVSALEKVSAAPDSASALLDPGQVGEDFE